jgi:exodeoxyribonuclease VII large subunit
MPETAANVPEYSVTELSQALRRAVEDRFAFVKVRGEISGFKAAASGHLYFALKDENARLDAVMWRGVASSLRFRPEDGLEVIATGKLTTYPGRSNYQIVVERMEPAGVGALMALLEERRKKLAAEGLFDAARKQPLPYLPEVIGVITSPTGAVIRDIAHRLADRFPRQVLLWPVLVQGDAAAAQVAAAVAGFNALPEQGHIRRPDVLIVARGGGSIEDLWAFNEEVVVRAVAASSIPVISAVGHETDTTLIDFVSDRRAPTPTAAAEMAVPVKADLDYTVGDLGLRLGRALAKGVERRNDLLRGLGRGLPHPRHLLGTASQRLDELSGRLPRALGQGAKLWQARLATATARLTPAGLTRQLSSAADRLAREERALTRAALRPREHAAQQLAQAARMLDSLSPLAVLGRGYAVVKARGGAVVTSAAGAREAALLTLEFQDGVVDVSTGSPTGPARAKAAAPEPGTPPKQGQLL